MTRSRLLEATLPAARARQAAVLARRDGRGAAAAAPAVAGTWPRFAKRALDLSLATLLLALAFPALVVLALVVKVSSPGGAFYTQERVGRAGRPFRMLKLRTMVADAETRLRGDPAMMAAYVANGYKLPPEHDPRLTPVGRFLRRTSLDELPQLLNVIRGDMSLVGPRPVLADELETFGELKAHYQLVRPGITGYWQVMGRSLVDVDDRIEMERYYLERRSLGLDLVILLRTIPAVVLCRGAH